MARKCIGCASHFLKLRGRTKGWAGFIKTTKAVEDNWAFAVSCICVAFKDFFDREISSAGKASVIWVISNRMGICMRSVCSFKGLDKQIISNFIHFSPSLTALPNSTHYLTWRISLIAVLPTNTRMSFRDNFVLTSCVSKCFACVSHSHKQKGPPVFYN